MLFLDWCATWPVWLAPAPPLWAAVVAGIGGAVCLLPRGLPGRSLGILLLLPALFWPVAKPPAGRAWVTVLDVGQGLAVLAAGFWLSFGAVGALLYVGAAQVGETTGWREKLRAWGAEQWAATLASLPILLLVFQQLSVVSPLSNAIAIPLVTFIVTPAKTSSSPATTSLMDSAIVPLNWRPNGWGCAPNWRSSRPCNARWSRSGGRAWIVRCNARPAKTAGADRMLQRTEATTPTPAADRPPATLAAPGAGRRDAAGHLGRPCRCREDPARPGQALRHHPHHAACHARRAARIGGVRAGRR